MVEEFVRHSNLIFNGRNVAAANSWLIEFSQQHDPWDVLLNIIENPEHGEAAMFFAVKVLHRAIHLHWTDLSSSAQSYILQLLAGKVFSHVSSIYSNPPIKNQLCLVLAAIFCRSGSLEETEQLQHAILSLDCSNPVIMLNAMCVLRELPAETCSYTQGARNDTSIALTISSFQYSCLYLFCRAGVLMEEQLYTDQPALSERGAHVMAVAEFLLGSLQALCVWTDSSIGGREGAEGVSGRSWLDAEDLCTFAVQVQCESEQCRVSVQAEAQASTAIHVLCGRIVPLLLSIIRTSDGRAALPVELRDILEKCLHTGLELLLYFLQCAPSGSADPCSGVVSPSIVRAAVVGVYESITMVAGHIIECDLDSNGHAKLSLASLRDTLLRGSEYGDGEKGDAVRTAMSNAQIVSAAVNMNLCSIWDNGEDIYEQSNIAIIAMNFVECVMCLADRHLVVLANVPDGYMTIASMIFASILLPFYDCTLAVVEGLAVMIPECSSVSGESTAYSHGRVEAKMSFLLHALLCAPEAEGDHRLSGIISLFAALMTRCRLPLNLLPPLVKLTTEPVQPKFTDPLKGLVGYGSAAAAAHCNEDDCLVDNIVATRRECSQLLKLLWETVMQMDKCFADTVATSAVSALEDIHSFTANDPQMLQGRTFAEVLLFAMASAQDITCDVLSLDDEGDVDTDDEAEGTRPTVERLDGDQLDVLQLWVESSWAVMDFISSTILSGQTPPEILMQYMQLWKSQPYFVDALAHIATAPEQLESYSHYITQGLDISLYSFSFYPRDSLEVMENISTSCKTLASCHALKFAECLLNYAGVAGQYVGSQSREGIAVPLAAVDYRYFRVCGQFLRLSGVHNDLDHKRQGIAFCLGLICPAIETHLESTQAELDSSSRAEEWFRARHKLFRLIRRLNGLVRALLGDEVFTSFVPRLCRMVFSVAQITSETYVWMRGRKCNGGASSVDLYIDTGHCHVGEGITGRDQSMLEIGKLLEGTVDLLCNMCDCQPPVNTPQEWEVYIGEVIDNTLRIVQNVHLPKVIMLSTILVRWGTECDGGTPEQQCTVCSRLAELVDQILFHIQCKLDDPLLDHKSCDWLMEECNSCANMVRQVYLSGRKVLLCEASTQSTASSCVALRFMHLTASLLRQQQQHASVMEWSPMTARLFATVYAKWEAVAESLLEVCDFRDAYQQLAYELIVVLLVGFFYGSLSSKMKYWGDFFHSLLASFHDEGIATGGRLHDILYSASTEVFTSPSCRYQCEVWNGGEIPDGAVIMFPAGQGESILTPIVNAASAVADTLSDTFQKARRKNTAITTEKLCALFRMTVLVK